MSSKRTTSSNWLSKFQTNGQGNIIDYGSTICKNYLIPNKDLENFFRRLGWHRLKEKRHSFAESVNSDVAIAITGKLTVNYGNNEEVDTPFPHVFITKCVRAFQDAILNKLDVNEDKVVAAVMQASSKYESSLIIQFPLISALKDIQERIIHPEWKRLMREMNVVAELDTLPENEIMENELIQKNWWLVDAYVPLKRYTYKLDRFYRYIEDNQIRDEEPEEVNFEDIFKPEEDCSYVAKRIFSRNFYLDTQEGSRSSMNSAHTSENNSRRESTANGFMNGADSFENFGVNLNVWLPLFLSPNYPIMEPPLKHVEYSKQDTFSTTYTNGLSAEIDNLYALCQMIPAVIRCTQPYINKIGQACYRVFDGQREGFELWKRLTTSTNLDDDDAYTEKLSRDESFNLDDDSFFPYDEDETIEDLDGMFELRDDDVPGFHAGLNMSEDERLWESFRLTDVNNYTINTVRYLAAFYSRNDYEKWLFRNTEHEFKMASDLLEKTVADLFYSYFTCEFIFSGSNWYYFKNHRWHDDSADGINLARKLVDNKEGGFIAKIRQHKFIFERSIENEKDAAVRLQMQSICDKMDSLIRKLYTTTFLAKVIKMLRMLYLNPNFEKNRDENPNILVFNNCVIEFAEEKAIKRPGLPEDYCTLSTNIRYIQNVSNDDKKFLRIYFNQIYPDKQLRNWMWLYFVSGLVGGNPDKIITMHQGSGNNSKTQMIKLLEFSFGDYFITANNTEILANVRQNRSAAEPEKIRRKGRRWNVYNELNPTQPIDVGTFKNLSGDDSQGGARDLFGGSKTMYNMRLLAKTMLVFNEDPPFSSGAGDDALWDRVAKILYMSKWVKEAPDSTKKQWESRRFQLDRQFSTYLPQYAESFISLLIRSWNYYKRHKLPKCELIAKTTAAYRRTADICQLYVEERIQFHRTPDNLPDVNFKKSNVQLYADYQAWYVRTYPSGSSKNGILPRPAFEAEMGRKDISFEGTNYIGISIRSQQKKNDSSKSDDESNDESDDEDYEKVN